MNKTRIKVKGHYRIVERDEKGKFQHIEKWKQPNLCCCCGTWKATEPNGLCRDCAENCAGSLLKDKPCETIA